MTALPTEAFGVAGHEEDPAEEPPHSGTTYFRSALVLVDEVSQLLEARRALKESEARFAREAMRASILLKLADRLNAQLDVQAVLETMCDEAVHAFSLDAASVMLLNPESGALATSATLGLPREYSQQHRPVARDLLSASVQAVGTKVFIVPDVNNSEGLLNRDLYISCGIRSIACACMIRDGVVTGAVVLFSKILRTFDHDELLLLKGFADHATQAIANARLFGQYQQMAFELAMAYDKTLEGWSRALDLRDRETEGHCRRVSELAVRLGQAMGESPEAQVHIRRGALLHDIGKMGIPDRILHKKGALTEEEWAIMRRHPEYARDLLAPMPHLKDALEIPYAHHERWDGSGYPLGLAGRDIPKAARIFAVTDVWDSLRSDRPYREAWSAERVREHIRSLSGIHFDPLVVEGFLDLLDKEGL